MNALAYFTAGSLKSNIDKFKEAYRKMMMRQFGISVKGEELPISFNFEFPDGRSVEYLFYPKISTNFGKVYSGLIGKPESKVTNTTGDLTILDELAFKQNYFSGGEFSLAVNTQTTDKTGKSGVVVIQRIYKTKDDAVSAYRIFESEGGLYVCVEDVLTHLRWLKDKYTSSKTKLNIDFFPESPSYLK